MSDGIFTFYPQFKEFLPVYRDVARVWIGDGVHTGESGMLYAQYVDGTVVELGYVTLYSQAVEAGYTGSAADWVDGVINLVAMNKGATVRVTYQNSTSGTVRPTGEWTNEPHPEQGKFLWSKLVLTWIDSSTSEVYLVSYEGRDSAVVSVNGQVGEIVLHGSNLPISSTSEQTVKDYIDNKSYEPDFATDADIEALFS